MKPNKNVFIVDRKATRKSMVNIDENMKKLKSMIQIKVMIFKLNVYTKSIRQYERTKLTWKIKKCPRSKFQVDKKSKKL